MKSASAPVTLFALAVVIRSQSDLFCHPEIQCPHLSSASLESSASKLVGMYPESMLAAISLLFKHVKHERGWIKGREARVNGLSVRCSGILRRLHRLHITPISNLLLPVFVFILLEAHCLEVRPRSRAPRCMECMQGKPRLAEHGDLARPEVRSRCHRCRLHRTAAAHAPRTAHVYTARHNCKAPICAIEMYTVPPCTHYLPTPPQRVDESLRLA